MLQGLQVQLVATSRRYVPAGYLVPTDRIVPALPFPAELKSDTTRPPFASNRAWKLRTASFRSVEQVISARNRIAPLGHRNARDSHDALLLVA